MAEQKFHKQATGKHAGEWVPCKAEHSCRLENLTAPQVQQRQNREFLDARKSEVTDAEQAFALANVEVACDRRQVPVTEGGVPELEALTEHQTVQAQQLIDSGASREEMEEFIQSAINSEEFVAALAAKKRNEELAVEACADKETLRKFWEENEELFYEDVRQKGLDELALHEEIAILGKQINEFKDSYAPVVNAAAELEKEEMKADGMWREYEGNELGNLEVTSSFPSGSREWLEQRQQGLGGSDIGPIIGLKDAYNTRDDILRSKVEPITDEQVEAQMANNTEFSGALGRGNAWEKRIFNQVAKERPDLGVTFCKSSWADKDNPTHTANFDGLLTNENGEIDGVLEIKTASTEDKWGPVEGGLDSVPPTYRAQVLWYAHNASLKRIAVAVVLNDREVRVYESSMTDELRAEAAKNAVEADKFMDEVKKVRENPALLEKPVRKGFSKSATKDRGVSSKKTIFREVATMRGCSEEEVVAEFTAGFHEDEPASPENTAAHLRQLYVDTAKRNNLPPYLAVDIETTSTGETWGRIIEVGASVRGGRSSEHVETQKMSNLYGVPEKALRARGTGAEDVHHISPAMLAGKRSFSDPEVGAKFLKVAKQCGVLMAHNAVFENKWFKAHVPGYADAVRRGEIRILDTMRIAEHVVPSKRNTLQSFVEHHGISYEGAHRAYNDADMMAEGYEATLRSLRNE